ncbi:reverse transcriptase domain-containing protein [Tanacetum coccineum]|uniref:Reverse transcriptase domain-containing protein n=1 Tax=Tanacetum coccineum TaxID=301880 RepID=A0ABQ5FI15_9ASTR
MADNRTMAQMLQAPIEGYEDAIVVPPINANNFELKQTLINLVQIPEKLEDPGKFLIPCALKELDRTSALADSGASINLLPHSIYKQLELRALKPTRMTLELANLGKEDLVYYADKSEKNKNKHFVHAISVIDFSKDDPFSGRNHYAFEDPSPSSSPVKTVIILRIRPTNPLFEENDKDVEIKSSSSFTLTSPEESEFEAYLERDSIPPGIDLTLPLTLEVSSSNPTLPYPTGEKDLKKDLTVALDSTNSSILPPPLLDSDSPFTAELSANITLNSLGNEDKVFKPGILVYHAIHDKNLVTLEENLKENISSGTLLVFKEPSFFLPPPEPPDDFLNFEPNLVMKNVVLNEDFYQSKKTLPLNIEDVNSFTFIIWTFLPYFTYTEESPLIFSFRSENFVFDPDIVTFISQWHGLEVGSIRRIQGIGYGVLGFLGVGTTFDIFQNIHILYLRYGVLTSSGYGVLSFIPLWSLVSAGTDTPYLP